MSWVHEKKTKTTNMIQSFGLRIAKMIRST